MMRRTRGTVRSSERDGTEAIALDEDADDAGGHVGGDGAAEHGEQGEAGEVGSAVGGHGGDAADLDADAGEIGEAAEGVRREEGVARAQPSRRRFHLLGHFQVGYEFVEDGFNAYESADLGAGFWADAG